jgi:hypothetical protein
VPPIDNLQSTIYNLQSVNLQSAIRRSAIGNLQSVDLQSAICNLQ